MFLKDKMIKAGNAVGLNGAYGHQRASLSFTPGFSISLTGSFSVSGINIGLTYDQYKGYQSAIWRK